MEGVVGSSKTMTKGLFFKPHTLRSGGICILNDRAEFLNAGRKC